MMWAGLQRHLFDSVGGFWGNLFAHSVALLTGTSPEGGVCDTVGAVTTAAGGPGSRRVSLIILNGPNKL